MARLLLAPLNAIQPLAVPVTYGTIFLIQGLPCVEGGASTIAPLRASFVVALVIKVVLGKETMGRITSVIFSMAPWVKMGPLLSSRCFNRRCAFPREYPKSTEVCPLALFFDHQLLMSSRTSCCGVHLNAGSPKVHSVINV